MMITQEIPIVIHAQAIMIFQHKDVACLIQMISLLALNAVLVMAPTSVRLINSQII